MKSIFAVICGATHEKTQANVPCSRVERRNIEQMEHVFSRPRDPKPYDTGAKYMTHVSFRMPKAVFGMPKPCFL